MTAPSAWRRISWIRKRTRPSQSSLRDASSPERGSFFCVIIRGKNAFGEPLAVTHPFRLLTSFAATLPQGDGKPSQALPRQLPQRGSQAVMFVAKVLEETRKFPAVLLALPLGELSPQVTERAHAVSPVVKASDAIRNSPATSKSSPLGGAVAPQGATERVFPKSSDDFSPVFLPKAALTADFGQNSPGFGQCA